MKVKICGITNEEDADYSIKMGADIIGVILDFNVKRHGTSELIEKIKDKHPDAMVTAVYTSMPTTAGKEDYIQLHFRHTEEDISYIKNVLGKSVISVIDFSEEDLKERVKSYTDAGADYVLIEDRNGISSKISQLRKLPLNRIGIAGRIDSMNLEQLVPLGPALIDVSSSLEERVGKKSFEKVSEFFNKLGECSVIR